MSLSPLSLLEDFNRDSEKIRVSRRDRRGYPGGHGDRGRPSPPDPRNQSRRFPPPRTAGPPSATGGVRAASIAMSSGEPPSYKGNNYGDTPKTLFLFLVSPYPSEESEGDLEIVRVAGRGGVGRLINPGFSISPRALRLCYYIFYGNKGSPRPQGYPRDE